MDDDEFWGLIARLDWDHVGNDKRVVEPVINSLAAMPRGKIAGFQDLLAHKLHALDGRAWAKDIEFEVLLYVARWADEQQIDAPMSCQWLR